MKWFICVFLFCAQTFALQPPSPRISEATIQSRNNTFSSGDFSYIFSFPEGWGLADNICRPDGTAQFTIAPIRKGPSCTITVSNFPSEKEAQDELIHQSGTFNQTSEIEDGFEAKVSSGWYACRRKGTQLIQSWYLVPKKLMGAHSLLAWNALKVLPKLEKARGLDEIDFSDPSPVFVKNKGWVSKHPEKNLFVIYTETFPMSRVEPNKKSDRLYSLHITEMRKEAFFYLSWNPSPHDHERIYTTFLEEMMADLQKSQKNQSFGKPSIHMDKSYALLPGYPYTLVALSGDDFLFGFAVKIKSLIPSTPYFQERISEKDIETGINDCIRKVEWLNDDKF
ncbi:MAG: hypothetical protein KDK71_08455 [Chlamydiia bacterium]|nr:hypothetical protein [Chlamydiia bacterium]MCP5506583.1 hypothetical protein [Chlamydiales bacterium]